MLKVGSQPQIPPTDALPPMNDPMMGGGNEGGIQPTDDPTMGGDPDDMGMGDDSQEFDTNFDAGVDADEDTDPKKYIQQLTGKLSQSLRKYNNDLPRPDGELSKYVAGMILKQTTDGLTGNDKKDIIDKVNGNGDSDNGGDDDMMPMDDQTDGMDSMGGDGQPMMENARHRALVNEIFQDIMRKQDDEPCAPRQCKNSRVSFRKKPFTAPSMW